MSHWLLPLADLTPDQLRAIRLEPTEHCLICGGPGSGKTQILLHRAHHLMKQWRVPPERLRIFVFTNALKAYIRNALPLLDIPEHCVLTFDKWCLDFYDQHIRRPRPRDGKAVDFPKVRALVLQYIKSQPFKASLYDCVLVDEGQDLDNTSFEILKIIASHITVCFDHNQQIYDRGSFENDILSRLNLKKRNLLLLDNFRCCPYIVTLAATLLDDDKEREVFIKHYRTTQVERETPVLFKARDFAEERTRLIEVLRQRSTRGEKVAVLLPQKRQVYGFAQGLEEAGLEVETPENINFNTTVPKIMPYHSAKGLTFDTVLLPRLVNPSFPRLTPERITRLLFVGITRATKWVYLSTCKGSEITPLQRFEALAQQHLFSILNGQTADQTEILAPDAGQPKTEEDILDIL